MTLSYSAYLESCCNPRVYNIYERYTATVISSEFDMTEHDSDCSRNNKKRNRFAVSISPERGRKNWILSAWTSVNLRNPSIKYNPRGMEKAEGRGPPTWTPCIYPYVSRANLLRGSISVSCGSPSLRIISGFARSRRIRRCLLTSSSYYIGKVHRAVFSLGKNFLELRLRTILTASERPRNLKANNILQRDVTKRRDMT